MSRNTTNTQTQPALPHESQSDRWLKYGSNVVLTVILVVALAVGVTWLAQWGNKRFDLTLNSSLSLKPQTDTVLKGLKQHITLVSLYTRPVDKPEDAAQAQSVSDLLDEYKEQSSQIDVKIIDPATEKDKLEDLHQEFITRYGSQIKSYRDYLDAWAKDLDQVKKLTDVEAAAVAQFSNLGDQNDSIQAIVSTISDSVPEKLKDAKKDVDHELKQKHPDFKAAANSGKAMMQFISQLSGQVADFAPKIQGAAAYPAPFQKYMLDSVPRFQKMKQIADASIASADKLSELKVDQLEAALSVENPVLVLGENDWRIIPHAQVWQDDTDFRAVNASAKNVPRFAGEQQVTTAIYGLANPTKKKICFIRPGGPPFTEHGFPPFVPNGAFSVLAERLREYNFDVSEKDLSGQWAMQAQARQMPTAPEPSDEQIKDAIWVVLDFSANDNQQQMPLPKIGPKLKEHLDQGGSALVLVDVHGENLADAVKDWGIEIHPEAIGVHETVKLDPAAPSDPLESAKALTFVWDIQNYGDHMLAAPLKSLHALIAAPIVVRTSSAKNCTVTPLLPLTMGDLKVWGSTDEIQNLQSGKTAFHPDKGDLDSPIFGGAISEKSGAGRLVVIGSVNAMTDGFMHMYDRKLAQHDPPIKLNRSPGNGELFTNSVFWLAHLEPMIAISPGSMDVPRISDMSKGMLTFWRVGVLMVLLPGLVLAAGAFVYVRRRD